MCTFGKLDCKLADDVGRLTVASVASVVGGGGGGGVGACTVDTGEGGTAEEGDTVGCSDRSKGWLEELGVEG